MKNIDKLKIEFKKENKKHKILSTVILIEILVTIMIIANVKNITANIIIGLIAFIIFAILKSFNDNTVNKMECITNDIKNIDTITKAIEDSEK